LITGQEQEMVCENASSGLGQKVGQRILRWRIDQPGS